MSAPSKVVMPGGYDAELFAKGLAYYKVAVSAGVSKTVVVEDVMYRSDPSLRRLLVLRVDVPTFVPVTYKGWVSEAEKIMPLSCRVVSTTDGAVIHRSDTPNLYHAHSKLATRLLHNVDYVVYAGQTVVQAVSGYTLPLTRADARDVSSSPITRKAGITTKQFPVWSAGTYAPTDLATVDAIDVGYFAAHKDIKLYPPAAFNLVNSSTVPPWLDAQQRAEQYAVDAKALYSASCHGALSRTVRVSVATGEPAKPHVDVDITVELFGADFDHGYPQVLVYVRKAGTTRGELFVVSYSNGACVPSRTDDAQFMYGPDVTIVPNFLSAGNAAARAWLLSDWWPQHVSKYPLELLAGSFASFTPPPSKAKCPVWHVGAVWDKDDSRPRLIITGYDALALVEGSTPGDAEVTTSATVDDTYYTFSNAGSPQNILAASKSSSAEHLVDVLMTAPIHKTGMVFEMPDLELRTYSSHEERYIGAPFTVVGERDWRGEASVSYYSYPGLRCLMNHRQECWSHGKKVLDSSITVDSSTMRTATEVTLDWTSTDATHLLYVGKCGHTGVSVVAKVNSRTRAVELWALTGKAEYKFPDSSSLRVSSTVELDGHLSDSRDAFLPLFIHAVRDPPYYDELTTQFTTTSTSTDKVTVKPRFSYLSPQGVVGWYVGKKLLVIGVALTDALAADQRIFAARPDDPVAYAGAISRVDRAYPGPLLVNEVPRALRGECVVSMVVNLETDEITPLKTLFGVQDNVFPYRAKGPKGSLFVGPAVIRTGDDIKGVDP